LPELERLRQEFEPKGVGFLALSLDEDEDAVRRAAKRLGIQMPVATSQDELLGPLSVKGVPATVFVDREGIIVAAATGEKSLRSLRERARDLLQ
jgi:hypothetical protein